MPRNAIEIPPKLCEMCGEKFSRKYINGRLEDGNVFRRRRFCSLSCASSKAQVGRSALLWRARRLRGPECEACGVAKRLHAHHVDGDQANNAADDIQTLCNNCHNFWHAALERRGMPISGRMPRLF